MLAVLSGCNALLDIDHIEFGETTSTTGGAGPGGAGGSDTGEDCTDGTDDDGDGLEDCKDDDCAEFDCVAAPPQGWNGPVAFWIGPAGSTVPSCPAGWSTVLALFDEMVAPPATCAPCDCSPAAGGQCSMPTTLVYDTQNCSTQPNALLNPSAPSTCNTFTAPVGSSSAEGELSTVLDQGSCTPSGGTPSVEEVAWQNVVVICQNTAGGGCASGICAHDIDEPMKGCITQPGAVECPVGYSTQYDVHEGAIDERSCTACTCGSASGGSCAGGSTAIYSGTVCSGTALANVNTACVPFTLAQTQNSFIYIGDASPNGGGCAPAGGQPTGAAMQTGTLTVCCP
jgi:hypothetical protein